MIWDYDVLVLLLIVLTAVLALAVPNLLTATVLLGGYSFLMCVLWAEMGAVDVAFTEAAVGAGVSTVLMIATLRNVTQRSSD